LIITPKLKYPIPCFFLLGIAMDKDKVPPLIGAVLLVVGILVIFFVFFQAMMMVSGVGDYFREQFPEEEGQEEAAGPTAAFSWSTNDLDVDFMDESEQGDSDIRHWDWQFGDGDSSNQQHPSHTYNSDGDYRIRLTVEDQNGKTNSINSNVYVNMGNFDNGQTEDNFGDMSFDFGMGNILLPFAAAILVGILFIVMFLVGAAMIKAGWNLLKPGPSTIKMKIKPKKLEVEQGQPEPAYSQRPTHTSHPVSAQSQPAYQPRPTPDAVIASMKALPENQPVQQTSYSQANSGYNQQQSYTSSGPPQPLPQNPSPPTPSFESQPSQPIEENPPHSDQTDLGSFQSNSTNTPQNESTQSTTPSASDSSKTQTPTSSAPAQENKVQASVQSQQVAQKAQKSASPPTNSNSNKRQNHNSRPRQQPKKSQQNRKRSQQNNTKSKKGKGRGRKKKK
jgi:PKD repeat protein